MKIIIGDVFLYGNIDGHIFQGLVNDSKFFRIDGNMISMTGAYVEIEKSFLRWLMDHEANIFS